MARAGNCSTIRAKNARIGSSFCNNARIKAAFSLHFPALLQFSNGKDFLRNTKSGKKAVFSRFWAVFGGFSPPGGASAQAGRGGLQKFFARPVSKRRAKT